ncbi:unnamed protein product [Rhodiola kirilowii]
MGDRDNRLPPPPPPHQENQNNLPPLPQARRVLKDYATPTAYGYRSPILVPTVDNRDFDLKTSTIQMVQSNQFSGRDNEDPNSHLTTFLEVCATFKIHGFSEDAKLLRLFPFSLSGRAKDWLRSQTPDSFTTWEELAVAFLNKYFPPSKTAYYRNQKQISLNWMGKTFMKHVNGIRNIKGFVLTTTSTISKFSIPSTTVLMVTLDLLSTPPRVALLWN